MKTVLEVVNLNKKVKQNNQNYQILKDINFKVDEGEFISIMGPSGAGKSSLLYIMGILDDPSSGKIIIDNKDVAKLNDNQKSKIRRKNIGFVFQSYNLVPTLSVKDNILLPIYLDNKKVKNYENKVDEILDAISLSDKKNRTPMELSGGEQQRVAIGRSLINNPDIILLDEPIGNLDSKNGKAIMELLRKINREEKKTIVQVTHSKESTSYGTKICFLKDGEMNGVEEIC
ncbi:ABC transporter ATP-binding protein [Clostridium cibarium]|uniref:ABC transporter ATP-binding protein n=1 Tax=Clostridium cibarium TaxID=2762247 RepID=A0ABR8PT88_9CLOT|nr:ABC transporter ATP-binding protein [Clostridium cibarium]MBD7911390.1 ABC transporter ATP-binding protein [Clostridium cibarium]